MKILFNLNVYYFYNEGRNEYLCQILIESTNDVIWRRQCLTMVQKIAVETLSWDFIHYQLYELITSTFRKLKCWNWKLRTLVVYYKAGPYYSISSGLSGITGAKQKLKDIISTALETNIYPKQHWVKAVNKKKEEMAII